MVPLSRMPFVKFAAVGTLFVLSGVGTFARAGDQTEALGPVGPHQPILTTIGSKRVIAFYTPNSDTCDLQAVVWDNRDVNDTSAARLRISLTAGQIVHIDAPEQLSLNLQCGDRAETLAVVDHELSSFGAKEGTGN